jgi:hypothetical protein
MQVSIGGINLEAAIFESSRQAKQRAYSRVQAFSDTTILLGLFNTEYNLSIVVPQDFTTHEDIEETLLAMQGGTETLIDIEGVSHSVTVSQISPAHSGGQPKYYTVDVTLYENNA